MTSLKSLAIQASYACGLPKILSQSPETCLTTILYHRFIFAGESIRDARDRLKQQCDWLRRTYTAMQPSDAIDALKCSRLPRRPLLITIDDAIVDLLDFADIFNSFELPISVFACVGWCSNASPAEEETLLARVVSDLECYAGPDKVVPVYGGRLALDVSASRRHSAIDQLLFSKDEWLPHLEDVLRELRAETRTVSDDMCCSWNELAHLKKSGVFIGCHSMSHTKLATASRIRIDFEIKEAKRILEQKLSSCDAFAYPYGMSGTYSSFTTAALKKAGFTYAYLTVPGFADDEADLFHLPRVAMPDRPLEFEEFRARVGGGGVVLKKAIDFLRSNPEPDMV
jgi:peptidoglycan/xylan/chitin deacetylase (PgdA/CDA1 family)